MTTFWMTLTLAIAVIFIALIGMAIGWLVTGKSKMQPGACGKNPAKNRDDKSCGTNVTCSLCEKEDKEKDE